MSDLITSREDITEAASPEGVRVLAHRKLPCIRDVVRAGETAHSICIESNMLLMYI